MTQRSTEDKRWPTSLHPLFTHRQRRDELRVSTALGSVREEQKDAMSVFWLLTGTQQKVSKNIRLSFSQLAEKMENKRRGVDEMYLKEE